jgi:ferric-dicitrate binding protein FerR (iron transport regulator)
MNDPVHPRPTGAAFAPETPGGTPREPLDWPAEAGAADDVLREIRSRLKLRRRRRIRTVSLAAALLAMVGLTGRLALRKGGGADSALPPSVVVLMPARQTLGDGSIVDLKNDAMIRVAFTETVR